MCFVIGGHRRTVTDLRCERTQTTMLSFQAGESVFKNYALKDVHALDRFTSALQRRVHFVENAGNGGLLARLRHRYEQPINKHLIRHSLPTRRAFHPCDGATAN